MNNNLIEWLSQNFSWHGLLLCVVFLTMFYFFWFDEWTLEGD